MSDHGKAAGSTTSHENPAKPFSYGLNGVNVPLDNRLTMIMWICICVLIAIILIGRAAQFFNAHLRRVTSLTPDSSYLNYWASDHTRIWPWIKRNLLYAPLFRRRHNREIVLSRATSFGTLPSRLHMFLIAAFYIVNIVYCALLTYKDRPKAEIVADFRGRTGHLALVNIVPLVLFAGRNNPLIPLLRVSFDTYNLFHRWIGRLVVLQCIAHTVAWYINESAVQDGNVHAIGAHIKSMPFLVWGLLGTVTVVLMALQSPSPIRHAFYETFLHCHQALALTAFVGIWLHCDLGKLPSDAYIRGAAAIWIFERSMRLTRLIYYNLSFREGVSQVTVEALPGDGSTQACRVSVRLARPLVFTPGTHAYLYLPSLSLWMNHPFSIAWSSVATVSPTDDQSYMMQQYGPYKDDKDSLSSPSDSYVSPMHRVRHPDPRHHSNRPPVSRAASSRTTTTRARANTTLASSTTTTLVDGMYNGTTCSPGGNGSTARYHQTVHFIIAKRTGFTKKLFDAALAAPGGKLTMTGFLEGPYSTNTSTSSFLPFPVPFTPRLAALPSSPPCSPAMSRSTSSLFSLGSAVGSSSHWSSYSTVLLFAGGVGLTHHLPHLRTLLHLHAARLCATQRIVLVWTVRSTDCFEWVRQWMDEVLALPNRKQVLRIELYISGQKAPLAPAVEIKDASGLASTTSSSGSLKRQGTVKQALVMSRSETVKMYSGRPDLDEIVERVVEERIGAVGVGVCGPGAFSDDVRSAVRGQMHRRKTSARANAVGMSGGDAEAGKAGALGDPRVPTVDFVEEAFTW